MSRKEPNGSWGRRGVSRLGRRAQSIKEKRETSLFPHQIVDFIPAFNFAELMLAALFPPTHSIILYFIARVRPGMYVAKVAA